MSGAPLPTSLIALGGAVGTGIIAPAVVYVIRTWSWHVAFGLLGMLGLVWCVVWLAVAREGPITAEGTPCTEPAETGVPYRHLLTCGTVLGALILGFSAYSLSPAMRSAFAMLSRNTCSAAAMAPISSRRPVSGMTAAVSWSASPVRDRREHRHYDSADRAYRQRLALQRRLGRRFQCAGAIVAAIGNACGHLHKPIGIAGNLPGKRVEPLH